MEGDRHDRQDSPGLDHVRRRQWHVVLSPEECNGFLVCQNYLQELPGATNADFVKRFHARYGQDYPYITELAMGAYQGFMLWAEGVRKAGSVDRMKVIEALESGIAIDAPAAA